ncbi:MAG: metallopeptidase family protein [Pseudomonadota bacterium]
MSMEDGPQNQDEGEDAGEDGGDPRIEAGWRALEAGDVAAARQAAQAAIDDAPTPEAKTDIGAGSAKGRPKGEEKGRKADDGASLRLEGLLLLAACAREEGDTKGALESLSSAMEEDSDWCTPVLWTAELLAGEAENPDQLNDALRQARRALDLAEEEDEFLAALACTAAVELALGRKAAARKTLRDLPAADVPFDDPRASMDFADLLIEAGDPAEARVRLETLTAANPDLADAWYLLGVTAELTDDEDAKRAAWSKTRVLDLAAAEEPAGANGHSHAGHDHDHGDHDHGGHDHSHHGHDHGHHDHDHHDHEAPPHLSEEALVALAEETLAELPEDVRASLKNVPIVVADLPAAGDVAEGLDPRLLGMFSGTPHAQSGGVLEPAALTEILLFRLNIERAASDEETLREEVRTTLLHEAGHFFGLDEAQLAALGLD